MTKHVLVFLQGETEEVSCGRHYWKNETLVEMAQDLANNWQEPIDPEGNYRLYHNVKTAVLTKSGLPHKSRKPVYVETTLATYKGKDLLNLIKPNKGD